MTKRRSIAKNTYELSYKPSVNDKSLGLKFAHGLKGYSWMGKHFSVTSKSMNKTRLYSLCMCLNEINSQLHWNLLENVDKKIAKENDLHDVLFTDDMSTSDCLQLYVKQYPFKTALSNYLTDTYTVQPGFDQKLNSCDGDLMINGPLVI
jgi:hypothetical protein